MSAAATVAVFLALLAQAQNQAPTFRATSLTRSVRIIVRDMSTGKYGTLDVPLKKLPLVRK